MRSLTQLICECKDPKWRQRCPKQREDELEQKKNRGDLFRDFRVMGCLYHVCSILMVLWLVGRCNSLKRIWMEHGRALKTFCHGSWEKRRKLKRMKIAVEQSAPFWLEDSYACAMNNTHTVFIRIVERTVFHSTCTHHEQYTRTPWSLMKQYVSFAF